MPRRVADPITFRFRNVVELALRVSVRTLREDWPIRLCLTQKGPTADALIEQG